MMPELVSFTSSQRLKFLLTWSVWRQSRGAVAITHVFVSAFLMIDSVWPRPVSGKKTMDARRSKTQRLDDKLIVADRGSRKGMRAFRAPSRRLLERHASAL